MVIFLISLSFLSCINILQAETWWNKTNGYIPQMGRLINKSENPLVINEGDFLLISLHLCSVYIFILPMQTSSNF